MRLVITKLVETLAMQHFNLFIPVKGHSNFVSCVHCLLKFDAQSFVYIFISMHAYSRSVNILIFM